MVELRFFFSPSPPTPPPFFVQRNHFVIILIFNDSQSILRSKASNGCILSRKNPLNKYKVIAASTGNHWQKRRERLRRYKLPCTSNRQNSIKNVFALNWRESLMNPLYCGQEGCTMNCCIPGQSFYALRQFSLALCPTL